MDVTALSATDHKIVVLHGRLPTFQLYKHTKTVPAAVPEASKGTDFYKGMCWHGHKTGSKT